MGLGDAAYGTIEGFRDIKPCLESRALYGAVGAVVDVWLSDRFPDGFPNLEPMTTVSILPNPTLSRV